MIYNFIKWLVYADFLVCLLQGIDKCLSVCYTRVSRDERILILHLVIPDEMERIKKIRRRASLALRKSDAIQVLRIASILGVKLDD